MMKAIKKWRYLVPYLVKGLEED